MNPEIYNWAKENLKPEDGGWLAGFIAGEGYFSLNIPKDKHRKNPSARVSLSIWLREDDKGALEEIKRLWKLKNRVCKYRDTGGPSKPVVRLSIAQVAILRNRVVPTFRLYPLRAKKQRDFEIWAEAVEILYQKQITRLRSYRSWEKERLQEIASELTSIKQYIPPEDRE